MDHRRQQAGRRGRATRGLVGSCLALAACSGVVACTGTPQPDPPNERPVFHIENAMIRIPPPTVGPPPVLVGMPGALTPLGATALAFPLGDPVAATLIAPDPVTDTFEIELRGTQYRFAPRLGSLRGVPVDARSELGEELVVWERELPCLRFEPALELAVRAGDVATLRVTNGCDEAVSIDAIHMRLDATPFSIESALTGPIDRAGSSTIVIALAADAEATAEELVLFDVSSPMETTLHLTVYATP